MAQSKFAEALLNTLAPVLQIMATQQLVDLFNKFAFNDKKAYEATMASLYPAVDVHLEKLTSQSKSKIDDVIVAAFKSAIEQSASDNDYELVNADKD
jgi:hypothetical protein